MSDINQPAADAQSASDTSLSVNAADISTLIQQLNSEEDAQILDALNNLYYRMLIAKNGQNTNNSQDSLISLIIAQGSLPRFVSLLSSSNSQIVARTASCFAEIVAAQTPKCVNAVVESNALPSLVKLLSRQEDRDICDSAILSLREIAFDSRASRDLVLGLGTLDKLATIASSSNDTTPSPLPLSTLKSVSWCISTLCRGHRSRSVYYDALFAVLPTIVSLLHSDDNDVIDNAAQALSSLSELQSRNYEQNHQIDLILKSGVLPRLVALLSHTKLTTQSLALRTIGNILTGDEVQTKEVVDIGIIPLLLTFVDNNVPNLTLCREATWALSNIASEKQNIDALVNANTFPTLLRFASNVDLKSTRELKTIRDITWVISNTTNHGDPKTIQYIASLGWVVQMIRFLGANDHNIQLSSIDALRDFLKSGQRDIDNYASAPASASASAPASASAFASASASETPEVGAALFQKHNKNVYADLIERAQGIPALTALLTHPNFDVSANATALLVQYFGFEEENLL